MATTRPRGAKPTPRHKLLAATPFRPTVAAPAQFAVVPKQLSMWLNDQVGDCVTAEEAYAKAVWSVMSGLSELFVPDAEVKRWATKYGYLDGADLTEVMGSMSRDGFAVGGQNYKDGAYLAVDYSNETVLQAAIATGPVKIGIDANALPSGAGDANGWYTVATGNFGNEDHCVGLSGYGTAQYLYGALGTTVPSGLAALTPGYLLFTWSTIGFVTHAWLMGTCAEAWVRNPTTPGQAPAPPPVPPVPPVPPAPPVPPTPPAPVPVGPVPVVGKTAATTVSFTVPVGLFGHPQTVTVAIPSVAVTGTTVPAIPVPLGAAALGPVAQLLLQFGWKALPIVLAGLQAGKTPAQILADLLAALGK